MASRYGKLIWKHVYLFKVCFFWRKSGEGKRWKRKITREVLCLFLKFFLTSGKWLRKQEKKNRKSFLVHYPSVRGFYSCIFYINSCCHRYISYNLDFCTSYHAYSQTRSIHKIDSVRKHRPSQQQHQKFDVNFNFTTSAQVL